MANEWFDIDKDGLAKLLSHKGKVFLVHELIQNAWDTNCTRVQVGLTPAPGESLCWLVVEDDDPDGFQDIRHSFTLFAESAKKAARASAAGSTSARRSCSPFARKP